MIEHYRKVIAGVIIKDNSVLIGLRAKYNTWEFPGGKLEPGETYEQCLIRELQEELDIICTVSDHLGSSFFAHEDKNYELIFFKVISFTGIPVAKEHAEIKWVPFSSLPDYNFFKPDMIIVDLLMRSL